MSTDRNARRRDFAIRVEVSAKAASSTLVGVDVANWSFDLDLLDALTTEKSYQYRKPLLLHGKGIRVHSLTFSQSRVLKKDNART